MNVAAKISASDGDRVIDDCDSGISGSLNQTLLPINSIPTTKDAQNIPQNIPDPIVSALCEAKRAHREYPAGHTFGMTNPIVNGSMVTLGTCACGDSFSYPYGSAGHEKMDAAIEAHWQKFDHLPDKVDGRGQPIGSEAPAKPKPPRKRKTKEVVTAVIPSASDGDYGKWCDIISQMGSQNSAPEGLPAPTPASSVLLDTDDAGEADVAAAGPHAALRTEPAPHAPVGAGSLIEEPAPIGAPSLALSMAAEPADDWSPLLSAALDMAWREPPPVTDTLKALLDFSKVYGGGREVERPVMRWHGGKWILAPWIISHFPPHRVYVEPFGGGGSVLLRKPRSYAEIWNDLDDAIVNLFRVLRSPRASELVQLLRLTPFARTEFDETSGPWPDDPVERARHLVIRGFMGFGSNAHGRSTGFRANSNRSGTTPAHDWANYPEALLAAIERLSGVVIENRDATLVMETHDGAETLHYIDPPYVWQTRGDDGPDYSHEMDDAAHAALLAFLPSLKGMAVLSGYPHPMYDAALPAWRRVEREALADGARKRTEVLWLNPACADALDRQEPRLFDLATLDVANTPPHGHDGG